MLAITGGKLITMRDNTLETGTILIDHGKIIAVGERIDVPHDCQVIDAANKVITPGIIDAHSHMGIYSESLGWSGEDGNEESEPITPALNVIDAINPYDVGIVDSYMGGVTTAMVAPGSANPIGGQCAIIKTKPKPNIEDMILKRDAGLKIAFGENPRKTYGDQKKMPVTRMATAAMIRKELYKAQRYLNKRTNPDVDFDMNLETMIKVLQKEMPLRAHAHRADDIVTAIRIAKEFEVKLIIEHATEGHLIADYLAASQVPVILGPNLITRVKMELKELNLAAPSILFDKGVFFALMSDHPVLPSSFLPVYAGIAARYGLSKEEALRSITINAAKILGISQRVGCLAPGLDADIVVWSDYPLLLSAKPEMVFVDGDMEEVKY